jgi:hypothetical protein
MAIWRRRAAPQPVILDRLLALPSAADALAEDLGFRPGGLCSVCFRPIEERAFRDVQYDVRDWLNRNAEERMPTETAEDSHGFTWLTIHRTHD